MLLGTIVNITGRKDTLSSIVTKTTDGLENTATITIRILMNIAANIDLPVKYFPIGPRPLNPDGRLPSRPKTDGKLNKLARRYIILYNDASSHNYSNLIGKRSWMSLSGIRQYSKCYRSKACLMSI
jgi:hypothetical protein